MCGGTKPPRPAGRCLYVIGLGKTDSYFVLDGEANDRSLTESGKGKLSGYLPLEAPSSLQYGKLSITSALLNSVIPNESESHSVRAKL